MAPQEKWQSGWASGLVAGFFGWGLLTGLFLDWAEPQRGTFEFKARGKSARMPWRRLGRRLQLVCVPRVWEPGKLFLLFGWLSKQYPGPIPRVRIFLKKE